MSFCNLSSTITFDCVNKADLIGGGKDYVYVANLGELSGGSSTIALDGFGSGEVSGITLSSGATLYKLATTVDGVNANVTANVDATSKLTTYTMDVILRLAMESKSNIAAIQNLHQADKLVFFIPRQSGKVEIFCGSKGASASAFSRAIQFTSADGSTVSENTFQSVGERYLPQILNLGSEAATLAYLESLL